MSAGSILAVLSKIPWGQVVDNAPKVAEAAEKLWSRVTKTDAAAETLDADTKRAPSDPELLKRRVGALEQSLKTLQEEMQASSRLIKALAEQNTILVQRLEANRVKLVRLVAATAIGFALLLALAAFVMMR